MNVSMPPWIARLRAVVDASALEGLEPHGFTDESGNRRAVDVPLIAWLVGQRFELDAPLSIDLALWSVLARGSGDVSADWAEHGPLQDAEAPSRGEVAIEVWTERELSAIQALWTLGVERGKRAWCDRAELAARWCVEELQPDNATAHPWGVNVFATLAGGGDIEAELYAQTLVHNCQVGTGRPGRFANLVLLASLRSLEAADR